MVSEKTAEPTPEDAARKAAEAQAGMEQTLSVLGQRVREMWSYAVYWLELHWDKLKIRVVWYAVFALTGLAMLLTVALVVASAAVLLVLGSAQLLGEHLFGGSIALGYVTVGGTLLALVPIVLLIGGTIARRMIAGQLARKYAAKKQLQRAKYGHDVAERAAGVATT